MEDIKVGEYIRTDKGTIGKVIEIRIGPNNKMKEFINVYIIDNSMLTIENYIINHSFNIIDLIEVGDYVNGYKVLAVMEDMKTGEIHLEMQTDYTNETIGDCTIYNDDIKSIVTKQQFSSIEYKVKED